MTWTWLLAWNAYWLIFALAYMHLETKLGGGPPQGRASGELERREAESLNNRPV
jgi:hypothetical protein